MTGLYDNRELARHAADNYAGVQQVRLIGRDTPAGPLDITVRKGGGMVEAAIGATELVDGNILLTGDDRTQVTVPPASDDDSSAVVDVYYGGNLADRRAISQRIYDHIVEHADWDVELDSDDVEDILASRVKARS